MPADAHPTDARIQVLTRELSHAANTGILPEELLTRAMDGLLQVTRAPAGIACLADSQGKMLEVVTVRGIRPAAARTLPQSFRLDEPVTRPMHLGQTHLPEVEALHSKLGAEGVAGGIVLPLSNQGRLLGLLLALDRTGAAASSPLSDVTLATFQRDVSAALQNARVRHSLQSANTDLLRLLTLARILGEPRELEDTLTTVAQAAKSFANAVAAVVWLADPTERSLTRIVSLEPPGPDRFPRARFAYGEGLVGWVAETGQELHLDDVLSDPRLVAKEWARSRSIRCAYAFPLRFKDALVGVLSVLTSTPLAPPQLSLLGTYSDHAALAIGHARLLREGEARAEQLSGLMAVARALNEGNSPHRKLHMIAEACRRATGAAWLSIWGADSQKHELRLLHAEPASRGVPDHRTRLRFGAGFPGWTARHRKPRVTDNVEADPVAGSPQWYRARGIRACVSLPLLLNRRLLGVLHLGMAVPLAPDQLRLVEGYAALAAMSLGHRRRAPRRPRTP